MADVWALADDLQSKTGISMGSALTLLDPVALSAVSKAHVQVREGGRPRGGLYVTSKIVLPTSRQLSPCSHSAAPGAGCTRTCAAFKAKIRPRGALLARAPAQAMHSLKAQALDRFRTMRLPPREVWPHPKMRGFRHLADLTRELGKPRRVLAKLHKVRGSPPSQSSSCPVKRIPPRGAPHLSCGRLLPPPPLPSSNQLQGGRSKGNDLARAIQAQLQQEEGQQHTGSSATGTQAAAGLQAEVLPTDRVSMLCFTPSSDPLAVGVCECAPPAERSRRGVSCCRRCCCTITCAGQRVRPCAPPAHPLSPTPLLPAPGPPACPPPCQRRARHRAVPAGHHPGHHGQGGGQAGLPLPLPAPHAAVGAGAAAGHRPCALHLRRP